MKGAREPAQCSTKLRWIVEQFRVGGKDSANGYNRPHAN